MNAACPTCGQMALPASRYCRACYTVFTTPAMTAALPSPRRGARALQLLFLAVLAAGGWWAYSADTGGATDGRQSWSDGASGEGGGFASSASGDEHGSRRGIGPARTTPSARMPAPEAVVQVDPSQICGAEGSCEVTVRFASGEQARFAVRAQGASASALAPLDNDGHILIGRHGRAAILPAENGDAISIVRLAGRRWISLGGA